MDSDNERVLKKIEELMEQRGITRYKLAKDSGINNLTLTTILNERSTISWQNINKICKAMGISFLDFFALVDLDPTQRTSADFPFLEWEARSADHERLVVKIMKDIQEQLKQ